jgi:hypothetical protein
MAKQLVAEAKQLQLPAGTQAEDESADTDSGAETDVDSVVVVGSNQSAGPKVGKSSVIFDKDSKGNWVIKF